MIKCTSQRDTFAPMKPCRPHMGVLLLCAARALAADAAAITIPSISGALTVDGKPDEPAWQAARVLPLASANSARPSQPEERHASPPAAPTSASARRFRSRTAWWLIRRAATPTGGLRISSPGTFGCRIQRFAATSSLSLTVNAVGAYRLQGAGGVPSLEGAESLLVATHLGAGEWTVEAAIPLDRLGQIGFIDVQRVRAPRPDAPELRWYWPAANNQATFQFAAATNAPAPEFHPVAAAASQFSGRSSRHRPRLDTEERLDRNAT